jgi:prevent-host-death family protein
MYKIELLEAKKRLFKLVERANRGEQIGITHNGKLVALIVSPSPKASVQQIFEGIERIRKRARRTRKLNVKELIEKGRL